MTELDTPLRKVVGGQDRPRRCATHLEPGDRRRPAVPLPAPVRRARRAHRHPGAVRRRAGHRAGPGAAHQRPADARRGAVSCSRSPSATTAAGMLTLTFFNQAWRERDLKTGPVGAVRRQGQRVPRPAPAQRPGLPAARRGRRRRGDRGVRRRADPGLPGRRSGTAPGSIARCVRVVLDTFAAAARPAAGGLRAAAPPAGPRHRAAPDPPARRLGPSRAAARAPAEVGRGVRRPAVAGAAQAAAPPTGRPGPGRRGRTGCSPRSTRACRSR